MALSTAFPILNIAPAQVIRGNGVLAKSGDLLTRLGSRPLLVGGHQSLPKAQGYLAPALTELTSATATYTKDCSEVALSRFAPGG